MILSEQALRSLLERALEHVEVEPGAGIALEGSVAEGFGNETSDIDFVAIEQHERPVPSMPTLLFVDGHRVEVRIRTLRDVRAESERVLAAARAGRIGGVDYDDLDRCQRLAHAFCLRGREVVERARAGLGEEVLRELVSGWFAQLARGSSRCAVALAAMHAQAEAAAWAQTALAQAAKAWLARRGETYLSLKWISLQLERAGGAGELRERYARLASPARSGLEPDAYVRECVALLAELGVEPAALDPARARLGLRRSVTTWQIGERVHVVRERSDTFVLGPGAARVWRSLRFDLPLPEAVERADADPRDAGRVLAELHRLGLVRVRWRGGGDVDVRGQSSLPPAGAWPLVSLEDADAPGDPLAISLVPLPAGAYAEAGMSLMWANVEIENAREDALGALSAGQWGTLEAAARRMLRKASLAVLSAHGVVSAAARGQRDLTGGGTSWGRREADEEACLRLASIPGFPAGLAEEVAALERAIRVDDEASGRALLARLDDAVARIRTQTGTSLFPSSFVSQREWRRTLELGFDWVRLGAYLDSSFPLDEARDLLAGGGAAQAAG